VRLGLGGSASSVVVVGQGYVGLPLAMRAVEVGHRVVGFDASDELATRLTSAFSHIEDVPGSQVKAALATGRYRVVSSPEDLGDFDVAVITVPTPIRDGTPDLSYIEGAGKTIAPCIRPGSTVILESTTYPGTTEEMLVPILEDGSGFTAGKDFHVGYSPERIDPGNDTWSVQNIPKVVAGIDPDSLEAVRSFYETIVDQTVTVSTTRVAELAKLVENTFRHVNIALVNELAMFAYDLDIDLPETIAAAATKPFGFMPFQPGPGVGGTCLPIDPRYLSWHVRQRLGTDFRLIDLANAVNGAMPDYVVRRLVLGLNHRGKAVNGSRILLLGMSYKRNARDARESPAVRVAELLLDMHAEVRAADPYVEDGLLGARVVRVEPTPDELSSADAVMLLTDHDTFDLDAVSRHATYVFDTRHRLRGQTVEHL
jgi:UDP-N-acetyl-D-glucosamine dehydrogenase